MTTDTEPRTEIVLLEPRDRAALDVERLALIAEVDAALPDEIASPSEYVAIAELEKRLDVFLDRVEPVFDRHCKDAYRVWRSACDIRDVFLAVPKMLKGKARTLLGAYKANQDRIRRDEERRLSEEARAAEVARQQAEAKLLDAQGQKELAAAVRATPVDAPAIVLPSVVPDVGGLSYRQDWYWTPAGGDTPENRKRAVLMLVRNGEHPELLKLDDGALTNFAKNTKGTVKIPGITFASRQTPVRR